MKNLHDTFIHALNEEGITQKEFAEKRGIERSHVTKQFKDRNALTPEMKAVIFKGWSKPEIGIALFDAHIRDELIAAGLSDLIPSICLNLE